MYHSVVSGGSYEELRQMSLLNRKFFMLKGPMKLDAPEVYNKFSILYNSDNEALKRQFIQNLITLLPTITGSPETTGFFKNLLTGIFSEMKI